MGFHPGIFGQEVRGLQIEAVFQAQDIIGGKDDGGLATALGEAGHPGMTPELKAALRGQFPRLHHPHVQIYHVQLLNGFSLLMNILSKFDPNKNLIMRLKNWGVASKTMEHLFKH
jgi:hypothetical protein